MKKIFFAIVLLGVFGACKKSFLDRTPIASKVEEDFYKTPADAFQALVSAYSVLDISGYGNIALSSEIASDNCFGGGGNADNGFKQWDRFQTYNDHNTDAWTKYYQGIYRANVLLQKIEGVSFGNDTATKRQYIAEAHFLRAYFYFDLVRMFGHVPLITQPIEGSNYYVPQASADSVYMTIAADLKMAIAGCMSTSFSSMSSANYGRATKWAAEALLGRVYLYYTGYYGKNDLAGVYTKQDALAALKDVIANSGYGLVDKYANLFRASGAGSFAGQNNKEGVFVIQYTNAGLGNWNQQNGNRMQVMVGIRSQVIEPYYKGWGGATVNPKLWNAYESGDSRKTASIISIADEGLTSQYSLSDQYQYTGYFWKKYTPLYAGRPDSSGGDFQIDNYDNYVAIRYADVLLMASELSLATDLSGAQTYYDAVRDRAFGDNLHHKALTNDANGVKLLMEERRFELALEGLRYWDLLRQGLDAAKQAIDNTSSNSDFTVSFPLATKGLFEIPQSQVNLSNGTLIQNPGFNP